MVSEIFLIKLIIINKIINNNNNFNNKLFIIYNKSILMLHKLCILYNKVVFTFQSHLNLNKIKYFTHNLIIKFIFIISSQNIKLYNYYFSLQIGREIGQTMTH